MVWGLCGESQEKGDGAHTQNENLGRCLQIFLSKLVLKSMHFNVLLASFSITIKYQVSMVYSAFADTCESEPQITIALKY